MATKVVDIRTEQQKKRERKGWTIAEIEAWAARESERTKHLGKAEPGDLASGGDMKKFVESSDDDQE